MYMVKSMGGWEGGVCVYKYGEKYGGVEGGVCVCVYWYGEKYGVWEGWQEGGGGEVCV